MLLDNDTELMGLEIVDYDPEQGIQSPKTHAYRVRHVWSSGSLTERFEQMMSDPRVGELRGLVIGMWEYEGSDDVSGLLLDAAPQLQRLEALFVGDISADENEVSWIEQYELGEVVNALKGLKHFKARGGNGLGLTGLKHDALETLIVETGGLGGDVVRAIASAELPNLKHLEIWTGSNEYGGDVSKDDVMPLLVGTAYPGMKYPFPKLKYLGIRNSELADEVAEILAEATVMEQLEELDLSLGILTNRGMEALLKGSKLEHLKRLNVSNTYVTEDLVERAESRGVEVTAEELRDGEEDDGYWYVEVGE